MSTMLVMMLLVPVLSTVLIAGVVLILVSMFRSGSSQPLPDARSGPVSLHARVFRPDRKWSPGVAFDPTASGRITVVDGYLRWEPQQGQPWATPLTAVSVLAVSGATTIHADPYLDIAIEGSGPWRLIVSDKTINRVMGNDFKRFREARRAREFADLLTRGGARAGR